MTKTLSLAGVNNPGWSHGDTVEVRLVQATAPGTPTELTATASGTQIDLAWTAPAVDGGRAITGYRIEVSEDGGTNWDDLKADTGNDDTSYSHTGLAAGSTRYYRVSAINAVGPSEASDSVNASLDNAAPDAPTGLRASAEGTSKIELSWTAPALDGGSAITGYKIEVSSNGSTGWSDLEDDTGNSDTSYTHSGLAAGSTRHYRVSAINTVGTFGALRGRLRHHATERHDLHAEPRRPLVRRGHGGGGQCHKFWPHWIRILG